MQRRNGRAQGNHNVNQRHPHREEPELPNPARYPDQDQPRQNENNDGREENTENANGNDGVEPRSAPTADQEQPAQQRNVRDIAWTFLTTFFTSLIPENHLN